MKLSLLPLLHSNALAVLRMVQVLIILHAMSHTDTSKHYKHLYNYIEFKPLQCNRNMKHKIRL